MNCIKGREHEYKKRASMLGLTGEECKHCGLLKSTIENNSSKIDKGWETLERLAGVNSQKEDTYCKLHSFTGTKYDSENCSDCHSPKEDNKLEEGENKWWYERGYLDGFEEAKKQVSDLTSKFLGGIDDKTR